MGLSSNRYLRYKYLGVHTPPAGDAQLPAQVVARGGPPAATLAPADGDPPAAAAAFRLLDAALSRGGGGGGVGGGDLVGRLRDAGALRGGGAANLVAQYSTRRARVTRGGAAARPAACPRAGRCAAPPRSDLLRLKAKPVQRSAARLSHCGNVNYRDTRLARQAGGHAAEALGRRRRRRRGRRRRRRRGCARGQAGPARRAAARAGRRRPRCA